MCPRPKIYTMPPTVDLCVEVIDLLFYFMLLPVSYQGEFRNISFLMSRDSIDMLILTDRLGLPPENLGHGTYLVLVESRLTSILCILQKHVIRDLINGNIGVET